MIRDLHHLLWIEELLPITFDQKKMWGGVGYYFNEKLILVLTEESKATEYRGKSYPFELWYGAFFPIEKIKQSAVCARFPFLENHPGRREALYLPAEIEEFEALMKSVMLEINKGNPLFGLIIKETAAEKRARLEYTGEEVDTSQPRLFNTGPLKKVVQVGKKATQKSELKPAKKTKANKKSENAMMMEILKRRSQ